MKRISTLDAFSCSLELFTMNERIHVLQRQPKRISVTLSYRVHELLLTRSEEEGRSVSNLCAYILEESLDKQVKSEDPNVSHNNYNVQPRTNNHFNQNLKY